MLFIHEPSLYSNTNLIIYLLRQNKQATAKKAGGAGGAEDGEAANNDSENAAHAKGGPREADGVSAQEYVEVLLATHSAFAKVVKEAFDDDSLFVQALDKV
jgi:hypothetical protein